MSEKGDTLVNELLVPESCLKSQIEGNFDVLLFRFREPWIGVYYRESRICCDHSSQIILWPFIFRHCGDCESFYQPKNLKDRFQGKGYQLQSLPARAEHFSPSGCIREKRVILP